MADKQTFETVLEKHPTMNATGLTIPFDVEAVYGSKRVPVVAEINGSEYRGSVVRMGGKYILGIPREFRDRAGISPGDYIVVTVRRDEEPRIIIPPPDFAAALAADCHAADVWEKLSYTHKREYVGAIEEAKKPETRIRRIDGAVRMIAAMKK